jgi:hypothetical protein
MFNNNDNKKATFAACIVAFSTIKLRNIAVSVYFNAADVYKDKNWLSI